ncbi:MAG TPA: YjgN family protein [Nevskiaceae bacterium]|nr:YjgN family protein [Nevskiaceae bacterium]
MESESIMPAVAPAEPLPPQRLRFTGDGGEYFQIWIVNLLLTVLTLGIYSAWAKVRRLRYFYRNTELAGARFEYHGDPIAILKGRMIALGLLLAYQFAPRVSMRLFALVLLLLAVVMPWLLRQSFRFRMHNSSWRGLRFSFHGSVAEAYTSFLVLPIFSLITLYLGAPLMHQRIKQYQHGNARYGSERFGFHATAGNFYGAYWIIMLLFLLLIIAGGVVSGMAIAAASAGHGGKPNASAVLGGMLWMFGVIVAGFLAIGPLWLARIQNLVWNNTTLGAHRFESKVHAGRLIWITLTNFIGIVVTLGLFRPWADVRVARYLLESVALLPASSLDEFVAGQEQAMGAVGQEAADLFDIDIGL